VLFFKYLYRDLRLELCPRRANKIILMIKQRTSYLEKKLITILLFFLFYDISLLVW